MIHHKKTDDATLKRLEQEDIAIAKLEHRIRRLMRSGKMPTNSNGEKVLMHFGGSKIYGVSPSLLALTVFDRQRDQPKSILDALDDKVKH